MGSTVMSQRNTCSYRSTVQNCLPILFLLHSCTSTLQSQPMVGGTNPPMYHINRPPCIDFKHRLSRTETKLEISPLSPLPKSRRPHPFTRSTGTGHVRSLPCETILCRAPAVYALVSNDRPDGTCVLAAWCRVHFRARAARKEAVRAAWEGRGTGDVCNMGRKGASRKRACED